MKRLIRNTLSLALLIALSPAQAVDLISVYEAARTSDPQLQAAESQKLATGEGVVQARSALLPQIGATASFNKSPNSKSESIDTIPVAGGGVEFGRRTGSSDTSSRRYSIDLQQSLYNHSNYTRLKGARAQASKSEADYQSALDALAIRVSEAYFNTLTAQTDLEAAKAEEKAVARQLDQANQRFEVGLTAITDVHEARARHDASRAAVILSENALDDSFEALIELTGKSIDTISPLTDSLTLALPEPNEIESWVKTALDNNPGVQAAEFALEASDRNADTARAGHLPTLGASVGYSDGANWGSSSANGFEFPISGASQGGTIGLSLNIPIFAGFATQSAVRQALYTRDAAADQLEVQRRSVTRATRSAYRGVQAGMSSVEARQQALVSAKSALEATEAGFEVGTRTIVDVLLSQQQLFVAQREVARAKHGFILAGLRLKQAAGVIDVKDIQSVNALLQ